MNGILAQFSATVDAGFELAFNTTA